MTVDLSPPIPVSLFINALSEEYSVDRRDGSDGSTYGGSIEYTEDAATVELYLFRPSTSKEVVNVGEQFDGILGGICLPSEDIQVHDRLTYVGGRYEVMDPVEPQPNASNTEFYELSLKRVSQPHV